MSCDATPTTEISTLSLHDALPISVTKTEQRPGSIAACSMPQPKQTGTPSRSGAPQRAQLSVRASAPAGTVARPCAADRRSEEHTSELQSQSKLVCRLLLEKKNKNP